MAVNKVEINGETVLDLTADSVTPETMTEGTTAHNAAGEQIVGTYVAPVTSVNGQTGDVEIKAVLYEQQTLTNAQKQQARENIEAANKKTSYDLMLTTTGWNASTKQQTISAELGSGGGSYPWHADSNGTLSIAQSATDEQWEAWSAAAARAVAQEANSLTLQAMGDVPTVDIPVEVIIL